MAATESTGVSNRRRRRRRMVGRGANGDEWPEEAARNATPAPPSGRPPREPNGRRVVGRSSVAHQPPSPSDVRCSTHTAPKKNSVEKLGTHQASAPVPPSDCSNKERPIENRIKSPPLCVCVCVCSAVLPCVCVWFRMKDSGVTMPA